MMGVVALIGPGNNQVALVQKLASEVNLVGIVVSRNQTKSKPKRPWRLFANRIEGRVVGRPFVRVWHEMLRTYQRAYPSLPDVPVENVNNVNDPATLAFLQRLAPDLVIVSGTNLVGKKIIAWASDRGGILNMHTGISPYVKGGPNCTNWCLALRTFHLIGSTTMWLDAGIDTGAIIATEQAPLSGAESLEQLHWKVMEHAHGLYLRTVRAVEAGAARRVEQRALGAGRTFYTAQWSARAMARAYANYRLHYRPAYFSSDVHARATAALTLFPLTNREGAAARATT
jgi:folate-dependent phosphoribosylglycinamide formyltransferase PurN